MMKYDRNQYLKIDGIIEDIKNIEIERIFDERKAVEDLEIEDYPNVVIAYGEKVEYNNIFGGVKILITNEKALIKNEYIIPEFIEKIIINNIIYENNKESIKKLKNAIELFKIMGNPTKIYMAIELIDTEEIDYRYITTYKMTLLILSCLLNLELVALKILDKKIDINQKTEEGKTALIYASEKKMELVVLKILDKKEIEKEQIGEILIIACNNKNERIINKILEIPEINVNCMDMYQTTPLIWACINKKESIALKLLEYPNIKVNIKENLTGTTALLNCLNEIMKKVLLKLLEREDIDVDIITKNKTTPLLNAIKYKMEDIAIKILEKTGRRVIKERDEYGNNILQLANINKLNKLAKIILERTDIEYK